MANIVMRTGDLAYFDSFGGLIPCRVARIAGRSGIAASSQTVTAIVTAARGAYQRGQEVVTSALHIVPRRAVRGIRSTTHHPRIMPYSVDCDRAYN